MTRGIVVKTKDKVKIAANYNKKGHKKVLIIAPGWCMTKDSKAFRQIARAFSSSYDTICLDFRGHGASGGFYTFSAKEEKDIEAVVDFAKKKNYDEICLMGFSLGAAASSIYASKYKVDKLVLVSAPYDFDKIENQMYKKEAWLETFRKFELIRFLTIRPSLFIHKKTKPADIIDKITCPTFFIAGKKDPTVHLWHTKELYNAAKCKKALKIYENGINAEDLYLHHKKDFITSCLKWLNGDIN